MHGETKRRGATHASRSDRTASGRFAVPVALALLVLLAVLAEVLVMRLVAG